MAGTPVMLYCSKSSWNSLLVNFPPLSWTYLDGQGHLAYQIWPNFLATCSDVLLSSLTISTKLVTVSMTVSAWKMCGFPRIYTTAGPVRSTATSSTGIDMTSLLVTTGPLFLTLTAYSQAKSPSPKLHPLRQLHLPASYYRRRCVSTGDFLTPLWSEGVRKLTGTLQPSSFIPP